MTSFNVLPLDPGYALEIGLPFVPTKAITDCAEVIWNQENKARGHGLVNGPVYCLSGYRPDVLSLQLSEYRYVLARRRVPDIGLAIRPMAVTGILLCADGVVLGRRGADVASDAGLWEPAPAGGLSQPDPAGQVLEELREELGLDPSRVSPPQACGLIEDLESGVLDIVFRLQTEANADEIRHAHKTFATNEYASLAFVKSEDLAAFLDANSACLLPALRPMLHLLGLV